MLHQLMKSSELEDFKASNFDRDEWYKQDFFSSKRREGILAVVLLTWVRQFLLDSDTHAWNVPFAGVSKSIEALFLYYSILNRSHLFPSPVSLFYWIFTFSSLSIPSLLHHFSTFILFFLQFFSDIQMGDSPPWNDEAFFFSYLNQGWNDRHLQKFNH